MGKVSGHGGYWQTDTPVIGVVNVRLLVHNAEYEILTEVDVRETRSIGCGGWTEGLPRFRRLAHAVLKVAEDDVSYPQALGFTEGAEISFYVKRGALNQFDYVYLTIVESVRVVNDNSKARRVEVTCKHGRYIRGVPNPALGTEPAGVPLTPQQQQSQNPQ